MFWTIVLSVLLLLCSETSGTAEASRMIQLEGVHAELACRDCHGSDPALTPRPSSLAVRANGCTGCHQGYDQIFDQAMTTRTAEKKFVEHTFAGVDPDFYVNNCSSCHVSDCLDCHGGDGHGIVSATQEECLACHTGYFVGREYLGWAPREDHPRYQRGPVHLGERALKMRPDIHAELGMECKDCHSMKSLIAGQKAAQTCEECHQPDPGVIEHSIAAHMDKLECYACHSSWAPQEYGNYYLRFGKSNREAEKAFKTPRLKGEYLVRTYLRKQDAPPLGLNERQRYSPIRPEFITYYSDLRGGEYPLVENQLLGAEWKPFFPHTIRTGTVMCDHCHDDRRRYLLENEEDRLYRIDLDGLGLVSFWNQQGQTIRDGSFVSSQQFLRINKKDSAYTKAYVKRWKKLLGQDEKSLKE
ncbi:selenite/tellurite reduction operon b-type cytochrome iron-sulfur cluster-binding subunit ExtO [uncultured Desulfuromusa sp.]|uniref:selenite/tellurite reduction operon b-type cytochrome iron-sulfur cluster-binding subunit ExtO n=1 Tax=uncultured Desulfuromusa sp. TaxID=219183 RepID=UPI002AA7F00D|nr:selenite/tellurite reduction operon b-type cytochrome iron-sulfur cluster-binding subunit ExtO [uncultured Desulfuromusa sp.]